MSLVPPKGAGIGTGVRLQMSFHSMRDEKQILKGLNGRAKGGAGSIQMRASQCRAQWAAEELSNDSSQWGY